MSGADTRAFAPLPGALLQPRRSDANPIRPAEPRQRSDRPEKKEISLLAGSWQGTLMGSCPAMLQFFVDDAGTGIDWGAISGEGFFAAAFGGIDGVQVTIQAQSGSATMTLHGTVHRTRMSGTWRGTINHASMCGTWTSTLVVPARKSK